jgi:probable rRNA maturation factor
MTQRPPQIDISVLTQRWVQTDQKILAVCQRAVKVALKIGYAHLPKRHHLRTNSGAQEVSIVLASDAHIRTLNRNYRGQDKPTNVLSFPSLNAATTTTGPMILGDVILAFETTRREAAQEQKPFRAHATHLVVHGVLHLLGYDHLVDRDALKMERLERLALKDLGFADPYAGTVPTRDKPMPSQRLKARSTQR